MDDLLNVSFLEIGRLYRAKEVSPVEILKKVFNRFEKLEPELHAFITMMKKEALESAREAEKIFLSDSKASILTGIPFSVKDLFYTKDIRTTCGSNVLKDFVPPYSATVVEKYQQEGAILFGKNNMLEFAYGIAHPEFHQTNNPWDITKTAGGSSGGSAASVRLGMGYFSLGTDTGGSIRIPASYCGIVGLKPTFGIMSTHGVFPLSPSLDHVGPLAKTVEEIAVLLQVYKGENVSYKAWMMDRNKKKVGVLSESSLTSLTPEVKRVYEETLSLARGIVESIDNIELAGFQDTEEAVMNLVLPEAATIHQKWFPLQNQYAPMTFQQLETGKEHKTIDYLQALHMQKEWKKTVSDVFLNVDFLLMPTVAFPAPAEDPAIGDKELNEMTFTGPFNLSGHPAVTLNMGFTSTGLPVGMQIVGDYHKEEEILAFAYLLQESNRIKRRPSILLNM
jgi:aspartyl-tRNA(Asn)/glutamyl-tRNA(Gln) amidotransferase subunit A